MKVKLKVLLGTILLISVALNKSYAQEESPARLVIFKFAPLVLLEPVGGYQVGLEFPAKPNFSVQGEFAYLPYFYDADFGELEMFEQPEGFNAWAVKAEARYYFTDTEGTSIFSNAYTPDLQGAYLASQMQLKRITEQDSGYQWTFTGNPQYENFTLTTTIVKFNTKIGYQYIFDNGFVLDCYTGLGLRLVDTKIDRTDIAYYVRYGDAPVNFALGLKLGWAL